MSDIYSNDIDIFLPEKYNQERVFVNDVTDPDILRNLRLQELQRGQNVYQVLK